MFTIQTIAKNKGVLTPCPKSYNQSLQKIAKAFVIEKMKK
jgi:hypothetical protein